MKEEQKTQVKKALDALGTGIGKEKGDDFAKVSKDVIEKQMLPKNALGLSDAMVEGLYSQAYRLYNTGKYKEALELFRLLVMLDSTESKYTLGMAACLHMMKEYKSAISTYSLCAIIDPNSPIPHFHASDCYIQLKDFPSAIISLEMAVKRAGEKPEFQSLKDRGLMSIESLKKEMKEEGSVKAKKG